MENLNKNAINNGLVIAFVSLAMQLLIYYAFPSIVGSFTYSIILMLVSLALYIFLTIDLRKKIGGFWTFKEALKGIFLMSLIGNLLSSVFMFVFFRFIETDAFEKLSPAIEQNAINNLEKFGVTDQSKIDEAVERSLQQVKSIYQPDLKSFAIGIVTAILIGFVMSLIFAAIFKKNPPMFAPVDETES